MGDAWWLGVGCFWAIVRTIFSGTTPLHGCPLDIESWSENGSSRGMKLLEEFFDRLCRESITRIESIIATFEKEHKDFYLFGYFFTLVFCQRKS